ncbi:unnamed protein product [Tenebrio molitor]|nr:unnamed protein product [Tenebrio molitor]
MSDTYRAFQQKKIHVLKWHENVIFIFFLLPNYSCVNYNKKYVRSPVAKMRTNANECFYGK